jgi:acetyltransferase-like isoleucine patch superfamily enzyme
MPKDFSEIKPKDLRKRIINPSVSSFQKYCDFVIGESNVLFLISYEIITSLFGFFPGILGLLFRKYTYPHLLKRVGSNVVFGKHITIRHPKKISIGNNVVIDDYSVLDAKGEDNQGIEIGDNVFISRNTVISCKGGDIIIGSDSSIGANSLLYSETSLTLGRYVLIGAFGYLVAGGSHEFADTRTPIILQQSFSKGGIVIEDDVWFGADVKVLDGSSIKRGSIIGAGSVVNGVLPSYCIAAGAPAKVIKLRNSEEKIERVI